MDGRGKLLSLISNFFNELLIEYIDCNYPDLHIVMLPQTFMNPTGNDVDYFWELKQYSPCKRIIVIDDIYSSDVQQAVINQSQFVIGARYHSVVFAINQGVPFCALSYEHKIEGLLELLNATKHCLNIKDIFEDEASLNTASEKAKKIIDDIFISDNCCQQLRKEAKQYASQAFDKIEEIITSHALEKQ